MGSEITPVLGNEKDFMEFWNDLTHGSWDRKTLWSYWRIAKKRKQLMLLRRLGPQESQILIIPVSILPTVTTAKHIRSMVQPGFGGFVLPKNKYLIFGEMIQDQNEYGQLHRGEYGKTSAESEASERSPSENIRAEDNPEEEQGFAKSDLAERVEGSQSETVMELAPVQTTKRKRGRPRKAA